MIYSNNVGCRAILLQRLVFNRTGRTIFNRLVPENRPEYEHTLEGADDMPAHAKSTLSGVSLTIPITNGHLNMGTWQGIYFCEYRNYGGARRLVVTIIGE